MRNSQIDFASLLSDAKQTSFIELVLDSLSDSFFIIDRECRYLVFNAAHKKSIKKLFGTDIEKGKSMLGYLTSPELKETFRQHCELALQGKSFVSTNLIGDANLQQRWIKTNFQPVFNAPHEVIAIAIQVSDITDQKQIENELLDSQALYSSFVEHIPAGVFRKNLAGQYTYVNPLFCQLKGLRNDEIIGKTAFELANYQSLLASSDNYANHRSLIQGDIHHKLILETGKPVEVEEVYTRPDGSNQYLKVIKSPVFSANGDIIGSQGIQFDITDQKLIEQALIDSDRQQTNLISNLPGFVYRCVNDRYWTMKYISDGCQNITGYTPDDFINNKKLAFNDIIHPDYQDAIFKKWQELLREKKIFKEEYPIITAKHEIRWVWEQGHGVYDTKGELIHLEGFITDVTERKNAEELLHEKELFFEESQRAAGIGSYRLDFKTGQWNSSEVLDQIFGIDVSYDRNVEGWLHIVLPDDQDMMNHHFNDEVVRQHGPFNKEYRIKRVSDGEIRWVHGLGKLVEDEQHQIISMYGTIQDITTRKITENILRESEERFHRLFEQSFSVMLILDADTGQIVNANFAACEFYGWTKEEMLQKTIWQINVLSEDECRVQMSLVQNLKSKHSYFTHRKADGSLCEVDVYSASIEQGNHKLLHSIIHDITEQKKAERILVESERRFRELLSTVNLFSVILDMQGNIIFANNFLLHATDRKQEEIIGRNWFELFLPPDDPENINNVFFPSLKSGKVKTNIENFIRTKSGEKKLVSWNNTVLFDASGQPIGIASLGTDITQLRKASDLIRESLDRLDRAEKVSKSGNWELVLDSRVMKASAGAVLIYGIKGKEFDYEVIKKVPLPEYRQLMDETMKNLIENNQPYNIEFKIKAVDTGEIKDIHSKAFFDAKKRIVFGVIQDITEKKKIFDQLRESEQKLSTLFANMSEMVVIHEMIFDDKGQAQDYRLLECNKAFTDITGIPRENAIGKLATEVYRTPTAPYIEEYARVCKTGETTIFKTYFASFDKHFLVSAISLGENRFSTVSNDITEILKSQEEVLRTNQELENYMYVASHDLRSPLVNIQGFSQRLSKQNQELNAILNECGRNCELKDKMLQLSEEKIPNSLQYIQTNVSKMDKLINGLLQISRTGRLVMDIRLINMNNLIENVLNAYNYQLTEIEATVSKEALSDCYGDENQLNQLFSNLIGNAIKYRDPRRKLILEISSKVNFNKVTYAVKDNGIGIHPRYIEKIWDVFYRVDASDPDAGDGLGLSVARRIIDKHKGRISVESTEGVGSTFFVELSLSV